MNLCRLTAGVDLSEPAGSNWSSKTSIKFEVGASHWSETFMLFVRFRSNEIVSILCLA